jgi:ABC transport system ATP-binding/permease protein
LIVTQFKDNRYSKVEYNKDHETYYMLQKKISQAEFNKIHRIKALREALQTTLSEFRSNPKNSGNNEELFLKKNTRQFSRLQLLKNEMAEMARVNDLPEFKYLSDLTPYDFNPEVADSVTKYLDRMDKEFSRISNSASDRKDRFFNMNEIKLKQLENDYYNDKLEELVTKPYERKKILVYKNSLVQNTDPIYLDPYKKGFLNFRTHFYAPSKYIFGIKTDTYVFNISIVLLSTVLLYFALFHEVLGRTVRFFENLRFLK